MSTESKLYQVNVALKGVRTEGTDERTDRDILVKVVADDIDEARSVATEYVEELDIQRTETVIGEPVYVEQVVL